MAGLKPIYPGMNTVPFRVRTWLHLYLGNNADATPWCNRPYCLGVSAIFDFMHSEALLILEFFAATFAYDIGRLRMDIFDVHTNSIFCISDGFIG